MAKRLGEYQRDIQLNSSGARQGLEDFKQARKVVVKNIITVSIASNDVHAFSLSCTISMPKCAMLGFMMLSMNAEIQFDRREMLAWQRTSFFNCLESHSLHSE
jgi:hypothetical protein